MRLVALLALALAACPRATAHRPAFAESGSLFIQPYLQDPAPDGVSVLWWTDPMAGPHQLEFGAKFENVVPATSVAIPVVGKTLHRARVTGLAAREPVPYRVRSGPITSPVYSFRTAAAADSGFRLAVLGDGRTDNAAVIARHRGITRLVWSRRPDLALHTGDMVMYGEEVHWERFWRQIATASDADDPGPPFASHIPYVLVVGNHEIARDTHDLELSYAGGNLATTMARYRAFVENPSNGSARPDWNERYFAFDYGPATFVVLDTNNTSRDDFDNHRYLPDGSTPDWEPGSEQHRWLVRELARARARSAFTFVVMHQSPYSRGLHGAPGEEQGSYPLRVLDPLFHEQGVDGVFSAHDHLVGRAVTGAGDELNYFVNGNAGQDARDGAPGWERWLSDGVAERFFYDWAGTGHTSFLEVDVHPSGPRRWGATFRTLRDDGKEYDVVSIERDEPRP